jgi:hypothetical protein
MADPGNWFAPHAWSLGSHDPDGMCTAPACVDIKSCLEFTFPCPRENAHKRGRQHACKSQKLDT